MDNHRLHLNPICRPSVILLILAVLIGGYIRLFQVVQTPFPIGDGGMFFSMTMDLINNGFHLPKTISFNDLNLPNTYPPLGFFLAGYVSKLFRADLVDVFRILPAIISILTIPAFYLFAQQIIKNDTQLGIAILIFSLAVPSFEWMIKGGGIIRAPAFLFSILALTYIHRLYTQDKRINLFLSSFFSALVILLHPQIALYTACSALVFFLFLERNWKGLRKSIIVGGLALLLSAPWWLSMIIQYGFTPFINAFLTGEYSILSLVRYMFGNTMKEVGLTTIGIFGLLGVCSLLHERNYFLPTWAGVCILIDPRSTPRNLVIVLSLCTSYALGKILWQFGRQKTESWTDNRNILSTKLSRFLLIILFSQWVFSAFYTTFDISTNYSIKNEDISAMEWIKKNSASDSRFLVLTGMIQFDDPFSEWMPSLTNRTSLATVQGKEWDTRNDFGLVSDQYRSAQDCYLKSEECIHNWELDYSQMIDYIYLREEDNTLYDIQNKYTSVIAQGLQSSGQYEIVYETGFITILKKILSTSPITYNTIN